jgi:hypothetical protein
LHFAIVAGPAVGGTVTPELARRCAVEIGCSDCRRPFMARKYSKGAAKKVKRAMHKKKRGTLKSGRSGKTVTSRKQAIAIGLSEARQEGKKVPRKKKKKS